MITNDEFRAWLAGIKPGAAYYHGPSIKVDDDELHVIVTGLSGIGLETEGVIATPGVQLRTIGVQGNLDDAENFAYELDRAVLGAGFPLSIAGKRVVMIMHTGGMPSPLALDETNRSNYVCSYLIQQEA